MISHPPGPLGAALAAIFLFTTLAGCEVSSSDASEPAGTVTPQQASVQEASQPEALPAETPKMIAGLLEPWRGDFDAMVERRVIRVLVTYNKTNFFIDRGNQRGIVAEAGVAGYAIE